MKKITINRQLLLANMKYGISVVPKVSSTIPAYTCFLLQKKGDHIMIKCASYELEVISEFTHKGGDDMEVAIQADLFYSTISGMKDDEITITVNDKYHTQIVANKKKYSIPSYSPTEFPAMKIVKTMHSEHFPAESIIPYLPKALAAINRKDGSPVYTVVEIRTSDKKLFVTGCYQNMIYQSQTVTEMNDYVVYLSNPLADLLIAIDPKETMTISTDQKHSNVSIAVGNLTINALGLNTNYVRVEPILEKERELGFSVSKLEIVEALKRLRNFTSDKGDVFFTPSENGILLVAEFTEAGKRAEEELEATLIHDFSEQRIKLKVIMSAIENIDCDSIDMCISNKDNVPPIIKGSIASSVNERFVISKMLPRESEQGNRKTA